ncbi:MAG: alpha/beta hydrolase [Deltaproteobacteria bacterium]|nr:alpha/beta hydrolase [Deltaproteobacteria bacterium]
MTKTKGPRRPVTQKNPGKLAQLIRLREGFTKSSDGTAIYYKAVGFGFPIVLCNGMGVSTFFWKYFENAFKNHFRVITWDYRGHGRSAAPKNRDNVSVQALVEDCKAVCDELKVKKALFIGHSLGTQVVLEFYRRHARNVAGIVSCLGTFGRPMDYFYNSPLSKYIFEVFTALGLLFPKQSNFLSQLLIKNPFWYQLGGLMKMINTGMADKADAQKYVDHILSLDPQFFAKLSRSVQSHSAEDMLKRLKIPTLIIGADGDTFTPVWLAKKMHRVIPKSELIIIKNGSHAAIVEQPELINLRIEKFLRERILPSSLVSGKEAVSKSLAEAG